MIRVRALLWLSFPLLLVACPTQNAATLTGLKTFDVGAGGVHKAGLLTYDPAKYGLPPTGGPHNDAWMLCGVYDKPVANEHAVHNLEHGTVWITYRQDLAPAEIDKLKSFVKGEEYTLLAPYPKTINAEAVPSLPSNIIVSAWSVQKGYDKADDEIKTFISRYANGPDSKAPERGSQCGGPYAVTIPDERAQ